MTISRRTLLQVSAAGLALSVAAPATAHSTPASPFRHGVASGDPLPTSVILWTRVSVDDHAPTTVAWEVARDEGFRDVVKHGATVAHSDNDHTIHVDPWGLAPATRYFYRFTVTDGPHAGATSPVGTTWTTPSGTASPEEVTFAVASCANWEAGFFRAYADMAECARHGELDLVLHLGDYIYEMPRGAGPPFHGRVRDHEPAHRLTTLQDYRTRYAQYRTDPDLQAAHAALPWLVMWDDHESADNSWTHGAKGHDPARDGDWHARSAAAIQAWMEWMPTRRSTTAFRHLQYGDLVDLSVLDLRSHRDGPPVWTPASLTDPARTTLGSEQYEWLRTQIENSSARWTVLGSSVMFSPMNLIHLHENAQTEAVAKALSAHDTSSVPANTDQWDGYQAERRRILELLAEHNRTTLILSGDIHSEWAHSVWVGDKRIGVELAGSSVSAINANDMLRLPPDNPVSHLAEHLLRQSNPHLRHVDLDAHGYAIARIRHDEVQMHWMRVDDPSHPRSSVSDAISLTWKPDTGFTS